MDCVQLCLLEMQNTPSLELPQTTPTFSYSRSLLSSLVCHSLVCSEPHLPHCLFCTLPNGTSKETFETRERTSQLVKRASWPSTANVSPSCVAPRRYWNQIFPKLIFVFLFSLVDNVTLLSHNSVTRGLRLGVSGLSLARTWFSAVSVGPWLSTCLCSDFIFSTKISKPRYM